MEQLTFKEFTEQALRTESKITEAYMDKRAISTLLCIFITTGTLLDYIKKGIFYNKYEKYEEHSDALIKQITELASYLGTDRRKLHSDINFRVLHGLLGALTESSELAEILGNYLENGTLDEINILEEFGDFCWYKAIIFDELGIDEQTSRTNVINKLKVRYPDKYSDDNATNRNLKQERIELENGIT